MDKVKRVFGVPAVQSHSIYLGLPTFMMKSRRLQFEFLAERAAKRVGNWMSQSFSAGGKEVLIKSVIQSIPTYTMACFKIPVATCNNIERVCARFWWGDKEKDKRMHWKKWSELCKPKSRGGMGFRNLVNFNQALLAKQCWRLLKYPDSLVARVLRAKYYLDGDLMGAKLKSNCSYSWRSMMWGNELLRKGLMWKIGDGRSVRVFGDAWLPNMPSGRTVRIPKGYEELRVAQLMNENGAWELSRFRDVLWPFEAEEILKLDKISCEFRDLSYWKYEVRGEYSVKTGYLVASGFFNMHETSESTEMTKWWKYLWSFSLPQRIKIFAWRVFGNLIPTEMNLHKHHVPVFGRCGWCRKGWGSTAHTLMYCEKIRDCWSGMEFWEVLKKWREFDIGEIGRAMKAAVSRENFELWIVGMWLIWKALCAEKHKAMGRGWSDLQCESGRYIESYRLAVEQAAVEKRILPPEGSSTWSRPRKGRVRLDVDYAVDEERGRGGVGAVVRNSKGDILIAMAKPMTAAISSLHGELFALMHGICLCIEKELAPVEVHSDCMMAVIAAGEEEEDDSVLYTDLFEFFSMARKSIVLSINHVRREANMAAHELARLVRNLESTSVWHDCWPIWLLDIVRDDLS